MSQSAADAVPEFDAVIIGAGIAGLYQLHLLRKQGMRVRVLEAGSDVGGTWYWNRYPGARFDSESYSYCYSFSEALLEEWNWSEHFAAQPETLRYLQWVSEKLDLRRDIRFNTRVRAALYEPASRSWRIRAEDGSEVRARFMITALGGLSDPFIPDIPGRADFQGESWHTARWPHHPVDLSDKRVAVIGTGATAVQLITEISKNIGHLTVFQRTANYCKPLRNAPIDDATQARIHAEYEDIFRKCRESFAGFIHDVDPRSVFDVSDEERRAIYERLWAEPGFGFWLGNFADIATDRAANETIAEFVREKIRERVRDPKVAAMLTPTDHAFGTKRVPLESGYFEAYNRDNVVLIDTRATPIERITATGVKTSEGEFPVDIIIFATGFDAATGAHNRIDIRGDEGQSLKEKWASGPSTLLGMQTVGFPNMFIVGGGPQNSASFCNVPRCIEQNVEWVADTLAHLRAKGITYMAATPEAEAAWCEHVDETVAGTLIPDTASWFMGANIPGKKRGFLLYAGGLPIFRRKCDEVAAAGYAGFTLA
ncbi:MAG: flavin-containing monooxygenase [Gammaproteobacteria bacterium]